MRKRSIAVAGTMLIDHIREIGSLPARSELARILRVFDSAGGCVPNTGIDLRRLDPELEVEALGVVGADADGEAILSALAKEGLRVDRVVRRGQTAFTDVFAEREHDCRTFFSYAGSCDSLDVDDIPVDALQCDLFHIGYLLLLGTLDAPDAEYGTRMARLLASVKARGIPTSIDLVSENSDRCRQVVLPALPWVDYLTVNELEAGAVTGIPLRDGEGNLLPERIPRVLEALFALGVRRQAILHAPEGAWGRRADGTAAAEASNRLPPGFIKGTTGAGDAFCAGVLWATLQGKSLPETLICGNAAAQLSLTSDTPCGAMLPMQAAVERYGETLGRCPKPRLNLS